MSQNLSSTAIVIGALRVNTKLHSNALANATRRLIGYRHKFATVFLRYTVGNPTSLRNVAFHWLTSEYMQLASSFMQLAAAGCIGAAKYIFTVFLKGCK